MDRLEAFERMLADLQARLAATEERMQALRAQGKEKSVTFRQLMGEKLQLQAMLELYKMYDLL
ncbi:MAG: hypothetical protein MSP08_07235 [Clostridiales bacterium]|nr:hypothetical protein [Clostridiales bacterium]MCI7704112.1 hypothetical protein [Clostridiales bacterium]MDY3832520.1 hypothetical protein [Candidatus Ventricola sp.]